MGARNGRTRPGTFGPADVTGYQHIQIQPAHPVDGHGPPADAVPVKNASCVVSYGWLTRQLWTNGQGRAGGRCGGDPGGRVEGAVDRGLGHIGETQVVVASVTP